MSIDIKLVTQCLVPGLHAGSRGSRGARGQVSKGGPREAQRVSGMSQGCPRGPMGGPRAAGFTHYSNAHHAVLRALAVGKKWFGGGVAQPSPCPTHPSPALSLYQLSPNLAALQTDRSRSRIGRFTGSAGSPVRAVRRFERFAVFAGPHVPVVVPCQHTWSFRVKLSGSAVRVRKRPPWNMKGRRKG